MKEKTFAVRHSCSDNILKILLFGLPVCVLRVFVHMLDVVGGMVGD